VPLTCTMPRRRTWALTLLELTAALVILGLLLSIVQFTVNGISSGWRLRAAAHHVEATVRWAQNAAVARGEMTRVYYHLPEGSFWVGVGDETFSYHTLPRNIRFGRVCFGEIEVVGDVAVCRVYPDGTLDSHEVILSDADDQRASVSFARLTGEPVYEEEPQD